MRVCVGVCVSVLICGRVGGAVCRSAGVQVCTRAGVCVVGRGGESGGVVVGG